MPVTAIYGEGVYGESNYGVLVSPASADLVFGHMAGVRQISVIFAGATLSFSDYTSAVKITYGTSQATVVFNSTPILVNYPFPSDYDNLGELYEITSLDGSLIYTSTTNSLPSLYST